MLLKAIFFHQKSRKAPAWNFLLWSSYLNSLFQNIPLFFCPLIFKIFLKPQVRINKIAGENGVIYHPTSLSGSRSKIHISLKPFGGLQYLSPGILLNFLSKVQIPPWFWNIFKSMVSRLLVFRNPLASRGKLPFSQNIFQVAEREETMKSLLLLNMCYYNPLFVCP